MNRLLMMPLVTVEDRFKLLLELLTFSGTFSYGKIEDPENLNYTPEYNQCYKLLSEASMYINNASIVAARFKELIQYLSAEFIKEVGEEGDFSYIPDVYTGKVKLVQFLTKKTKVDKTGTGFAFIAKSGTVFQGTSTKDFINMKQVELLDILEWIDVDPEFPMDEKQHKVLKFILGNQGRLQTEFKTYRNALLAFLNWYYAPEIRNNIIVFILEELQIPHTYWPKAQAAVIAIKKAKAKAQKA